MQRDGWYHASNLCKQTTIWCWSTSIPGNSHLLSVAELFGSCERIMLIIILQTNWHLPFVECHHVSLLSSYDWPRICCGRKYLLWDSRIQKYSHLSCKFRNFLSLGVMGTTIYLIDSLKLQLLIWSKCTKSFRFSDSFDSLRSI